MKCAGQLLNPNQQTQQFVLNWFSLSRQQKRQHKWEQKDMYLYRSFIPLFFDDVDLQQLIVSQAELNQKFNKFFSTSFRFKTISNQNDNLFNLNELFLFNLDKSVQVWQASKKNMVKDNKNKRFSSICIQKQAIPWRKIEHSTNLIKIVPQNESQTTSIMYADKNIVSRFRLQILKEDYQIKNNFINQYLFCGTSPSFSLSTIIVQRYKKGQNFKAFDQKVYVIFQGSVIQQILTKKQVNIKQDRAIGDRLKFELVSGSIICKNNMRSILNGVAWSEQSQNYSYSYNLLLDCIFLAITYADLVKIIKNEKKTQKLLIQKIQTSMLAHQDFINKSINVQNKIRDTYNVPEQFSYSIPRNCKTRAFRRKKQSQSQQNNNYEEFITYHRYEIMTKNKQNVQKKHLVYSQLNNLLRQRQKQDRFIKKLNTVKGLKQIKKCEYMARMKQNKIENLAIKDSILNTQKYRAKPHEVKFIFEEQMMEYMRNTTDQPPDKRSKNKFMSLVLLINDQKSQSQCTKLNIKSQYQFCNRTDLKSSKAFNKSLKMVKCQSSPNFEHVQFTNRKIKKQARIGSAFNIQKTQGKML